MSGPESTNGMGRRGALLIQTIAAGIERIDAADPVISPDPNMNAVDHLYPLSGNRWDTSFFEQVRGTPINSSSADVAATQQANRCHRVVARG
jgi:hypothetical protein